MELRPSYINVFQQETIVTFALLHINTLDILHHKSHCETIHLSV